ncbi:hypothetical protein PROFUN_16108, partial [Planoprotostelium fungivorum]
MEGGANKANMDQTTLMKRIVPALQYATLAVDFDRKGAILAAITNYKLAVSMSTSKQSLTRAKTRILENEMDNMPEENRSKIETLLRQYNERIDELEKQVPVSPSNRMSIGPIRPEFTEESSSGDMPDKPPSNAALQPFWLMKIFSKTISQGGYLTPDIWLSPTTWVQSGSKKSMGLSSKQSCTDNLLQYVQKLSEIKTEDSDTITRELEGFCIQLGVIQNTLSKALGYVPEYLEDTPKKEKGMNTVFKKVGEKIARGAKGISVGLRGQKADETILLYVSTLNELFDSSQVLGKWIEHYNGKSSTSLTNSLKRISEFYTVVICNIVVKDLNSQIRKMMKNNRK